MQRVFAGIGLGLFAMLAFTPAAIAATQAEVIAALQAQVRALTERLDRVEQQSQQWRTVPVHDLGATGAAEGTAPLVRPARSWIDRIKLKGDFRYRHDYTDEEGKSDRHRQRIRARAALIAQPRDDVEVGFGLASGGDSGVSANQTLGEGFSTKDIGLDLAYARWNPGVEGLSVTGGKFKNPLHRTAGNGLLWDGDLRPEGAVVQFHRGMFFGTAMALWAEEASQAEDTIVFTGQGGIRHAFSNGSTLTAGVGYYDLGALKDEQVLDEAFGNTTYVDANGDERYLYGYEEFEAFAEYSFKLGEQPFMVFADYVQNQDAGKYDTGYAVGGRWSGKLGNRKVRFEYIYQDLEADAVLGAFSDSDFINGGTDGTGHIVKWTHNFGAAFNVKATVFVNEKGANAGDEIDFDRVFLDFNFKY